MAMSERERRRIQLRPLFVYLRQNGISGMWLARQIGIEPPEDIYQIGHGRRIIPPLFIERACQALRRTPEEVGFYVPQRETARRRKSA